jgi:hypothetical protein
VFQEFLRGLNRLHHGADPRHANTAFTTKRIHSEGCVHFINIWDEEDVKGEWIDDWKPDVFALEAARGKCQPRTIRGRRATEADSKHRFPVLESRPTKPGGPGVNQDLGVDGFALPVHSADAYYHLLPQGEG